MAHDIVKLHSEEIQKLYQQTLFTLHLLCVVKLLVKHFITRYFWVPPMAVCLVRAEAADLYLYSRNGSKWNAAFA